MPFKKSRIPKLQIFDSSVKPKGDQQYRLTVQFHTGSRYVYYGKTKTIAEKKFKDKWGSYLGFVRKEWSTSDD